MNELGQSVVHLGELEMEVGPQLVVFLHRRDASGGVAVPVPLNLKVCTGQMSHNNG
jgi:hypothetical protein